MPALIPKPENVASPVRVIRGERALLDSDLATLYGVETRTLNQAVKRNPERFPGDFMCQLTQDVAQALLAARSQSVTLKRGNPRPS
jgi:hypothetical protein